MTRTARQRCPEAKEARKQALNDLRRRQILDSAQCVFARDGFAATHVEDIARDAGLAKGTVYLYFDSKQDIYRALLLEQFAAINLVTREVLSKCTTIEEKVRLYIATRLEFCDSQRDFFRVMLTEVGNVAGKPLVTRCEMQELCSVPVQELASHLQQAVDANEIRPINPEQTAWMISDLLRGASERRLLGRSDHTSVEEDAHLVFSTIWCGLAVPEAPPAKASSRRKVTPASGT